MDESSTDVRSLELVWNQYKGNNYEIEMTGAKTKKCLICFSGHGLYFPNTVDAFEERIIKQNRYEWKNITQSKLVKKEYEKIIYVRDLWKTWYLYGINQEIATQDDLLLFLKKETKNYEIYTVGNSAGGYAATLYGCLLNAKLVYNFSGQYEIEIQKGWNIMTSESEGKEKRRIDEKWYSICNVVKKGTKTKIFYFVPNEVISDLEQYEHVKDCSNIYSFFIESKNHGTTVLGVNYKYIFTLSEVKMLRIYNKFKRKAINRFEFLFHTVGICRGIYACYEMILYKKKHKTSMGL